MPIITVFPDVVRAYNRVEINWADTPTVTYAKVTRVDVVTGECVPLRPYVCFDGDYLALSCGHGVFWDTEVPLDRSVYYITEGLDAPCIPTDLLAFDTFSRVSASTWTTADSGQAYTLLGGVAANHTVNGTQGLINVTATSSDRADTINVGTPTQVGRVRLVNPVMPTGSNSQQGMVLRLSSPTDYYVFAAGITVGGVVNAQINKVVGGVLTSLGTVASGLSPGTGDIFMTAYAVGSDLKLRLYQGSEPTTWNLEVTDSDLVVGDSGGAFARRTGGNLTPLVYTYDDLSISNPCAPCDPVDASTESTPTTMPSNGAFRLRDPVRPCNDIYVPLCFNQADPGCVPGKGTFFASVGPTETRTTNSLLLNPTNAALPLLVNRQRRGMSSILTLVTRTFDDRNDLIRINKPGTPLMLAGPPQYGVPDMYMAVGDTDVIRELSNHKYPVRVNELPFVEVGRPAGPSLGVCGSRMQDICDIYPTFDAMTAAGITWEDLIRGRAGDEGTLDGYRTWTIGANTVLADFADWNAVDDGTRDWTGLEMGD